MTQPSLYMQFSFPSIFHIRSHVNGNTVQQLLSPPETMAVDVTQYQQGKIRGVILKGSNQVTTLLLPTSSQLPETFDRILGVRGARVPVDEASLGAANRTMHWLRPAQNVRADHLDVISAQERVNEVRASWAHQLTYRFEKRDREGNIIEQGLRAPQVGALHAILAHWTVSSSPATVVMPTGTGKTETMLALLIANQCDKVLVIVPTDPLREQIAGKFLALGVLKTCGVIGKTALYPVVGVLKHKPRTMTEVDELFKCCNVVVTTMSIAAGTDHLLQKRMAASCSHLFIDEAHHIPAPTWRSFRKCFEEKHIVQFTATPFRRDGKHIDGNLIFNYPLLKAQEEGYFKPINFVPVFEFNPRRADAAIAKEAVDRLKKDLAAGYNHILMARVKNVDRIEEILSLYTQYPEYNPVVIHSRLKTSQRKAALQKIQTGETRIIVCVDMLGEGFDLPELKIAALHDIHKSLGVTLQFTGRFTRTRHDIGEATVIANTADAQVSDTLAELYGENADWNKLLRSKGTAAIEEQVKLNDFLEGFTGLPNDLPVQNLRPKMSTAIYRMGGSKWKPEEFRAALGKDVEATHVLNPKEKVLVFVTKKKEPIDWGDLKEISNLIYELYVVFWDQRQGLLFINSTDTRGYHSKLAEAIGGEATAVIKGDTVFRCFHGMKRVVLQNVGLNKAYSGPLRYVMFTGIDVGEGLSQAHRRNTFKSNLFGQGYEEGTKTSVGCSYKGRVWSRRISTVAGLCEWCSHVGKKIMDETINVDTVLEGVLKPVLITKRPELMPIAIEWPASFLSEPESFVSVLFKDEVVPLYETSIDLIDPNEDGPLKFVIHAGPLSAEYELQIFSEEEGKGFRYLPLSRKQISFKVGGKTKPLAEWADDDPPIIRFVDNSYIENNLHIGSGDEAPVPFQKEAIEAWDWTGVDLKTESQGEERRSNSIQYRVLSQLKQAGYDILFDDDSAGEAADIVAIQILDQKVSVKLYHCKYCHGNTPGARIKDLYEVCGQAQKSIHWKEDIRRLLTHMKKRELRRTDYSKPTRFETGDMSTLVQVEKMIRFFRSDFKIFIVQPGLSKAQASSAQLELLGATELYLKETYNIGLGVIASP